MIDMNDNYLYKGQPFAFRGQVIFTANDPSMSLDDYDVVVKLSTTIRGKSILAYTPYRQGDVWIDRGDISIAREENNHFSLTVPQTLSRKLSSGSIVISVQVKYKGSDFPYMGEADSGIALRDIRFLESEL